MNTLNFLLMNCRYLLPMVISVLVFACHEEQVVVLPVVENLNSFKMNLNSTKWEPTVISSCEKTFHAAMSSLNSKPYYNIEAYRDSKAKTSLDSENLLQIQIMNVTKAGDYVINGSSFENFSSYARFRINDNERLRIYQNKTNNVSFQVSINELLPITNSTLVGIKGSYSGVLYNIENPLDSVVIKKGEFVFRKINSYNFNQCAE